MKTILMVIGIIAAATPVVIWTAIALWIETDGLFDRLFRKGL